MNIFRKLLIKASFVTFYAYPHDDRKPFREFLRCALHSDHKYTGPKEVHHGYIFQKCVHWGCRYLNPLDENTEEHQILINIDFWRTCLLVIDTPPRLYGCLHLLPTIKERLACWESELQKLSKVNP